MCKEREEQEVSPSGELGHMSGNGHWEIWRVSSRLGGVEDYSGREGGEIEVKEENSCQVLSMVRDYG